MRPDPGPVVDLALAGPATLGRSRLVCVDGPAGSGKSTLGDLVAAEVRRRGRSAALVHLDDLYDGWDGLPDVGQRVRRWVVDPLAEGRPGEHPRYDWHLGEYAERHAVPPADVVVLEGVGSASPLYADRIAVLVWVDAPEELRLRRGLDRDGAALEREWRRWLVEERMLHQREDTRARADVLVDGATGGVEVVRPAARTPRAPL